MGVDRHRQGRRESSTCKQQRHRQDPLCNVWGVELAENLDFLLDIFNLIFGTLQIDDFNGDGLLCSLVVPVPTVSDEQPLYSVNDDAPLVNLTE
jgi:hypothetical protein